MKVNILICALIGFILCSCSSNCTRTKRYWSNHRCVNVNDTIPDYFYANNQIVIIEKQR